VRVGFRETAAKETHCYSNIACMLVRIDQGSEVPLGKQIAFQIRAGISDGSVQVGERLPPARELAQALGVNMHTVLRAYSGLRAEGIVEMRQGRGAWVRARTSPEHAKLTRLAEKILAEAHEMGLTRADVIRLIERI